MKKIGILFGQENTFPQAFVDRVNSKKVKGIKAELAKVNVVEQGKATQYDVLIDRISQDIPFYRAYLKNAALEVADGNYDQKISNKGDDELSELIKNY